MKITRPFAGILSVCALSALSVSAYAAPGDLDTTFSGDGKVITSLSGDQEQAQDVATQSDGKIVVAGNNGNSIALIRYLANGTLDTSFGSSGSVVVPTTNSLRYYTTRVRIQGDGKILVGGYVVNPFSDSGIGLGERNSLFLARFTTNGVLDTTFGSNGNGIVRRYVGDATSGGIDTVGRDFAILGNGKIVVVGYTEGTDNDVVLTRFNSNGTADSTFNSGSLIVTPLGTNLDRAYAVAVQSDGKIIATGQRGGDVALIRYTAAGALDYSFSGNAVQVTDYGSSNDIAKGVALQSDGKIVVAVSRGGTLLFAVGRYVTDGNLDTSFGSGGFFSGGIVTTTFNVTSESNRVAIQSNGKIVLGGYAGDAFAAVRYNTNGSLDTTFSTDGKVTVPLGSSSARSYGLALQSDGKIVLSGSATDVSTTISEFGTIRLQGDAVTAAATTTPSGGTS